MGRLFWKLFAGLSITLVLVGGGIGGAVYLHDERLKSEVGFLSDRRAEFVVGLTANTLKYADVVGLKALFDDWPGTYKAPLVMVVDAAGNDALGRIIPASSLAKALTALRDQREILSVQKVKSRSGNEYVVFLPSANANLGGSSYRPPPPEVQILIALCASLLFSAAFAIYLSRPIRHLRKVSQRLAEGDFDARVSHLIGGRNDELSDLGNDFDYMATQLQAVLNAQRQLLHDVSHELRSPVARMRLAIGLAQQQPEKSAMALARIERETERLDELLGQILTLARLESGLSNETQEKVSLNELLEEIVQDMNFEAQALGLRVDYQAKSETVIDGQRELLRRAFENVIRNAIKYGTDGELVEVRLINKEKTKTTVEIRDHGPGIPEQQLEAVFQPFYRLPGKEKERISGFGLGLAITRRAIHKHKGSITISNAIGGGLLVKIDFEKPRAKLP